MANDSTQRPRVVPAIPLNFTKEPISRSSATPLNSGDPLIKSAQQHSQRNSTLILQSSTPDSNTPLTPESTTAAPIQNVIERYGHTEAKSKGHDQIDVAGETTNGYRNVADVVPLPSNADSSIPDSVPGQVASKDVSPPTQPHKELDETFQPRDIQPSPDSYKVRNAEEPVSFAPGINMEKAELGKRQRRHESHPSVDKLVFGDMGHTFGPSPVAFSPTQQLPPPPYAPYQSINVDAVPFVPASMGHVIPNLQSEPGFAPFPASSAPVATYRPVQPWYPPEAFQYAATPVYVSQPISPTHSHSSSVHGQHLTTALKQVGEEDPLGQGAIRTSLPQRASDDHLQDSAYGSNEPEAVNGGSVQDYVLSQFGQMDLADCVVEVRSSNNDRLVTRLPIHRLFAVRSSRLASVLLAGSPTAEYDALGLRVVRLIVSDTFITATGITDAIRSLYGGSLPVGDDLRVEASLGSTSQGSIQLSLGLAAAGRLLYLVDVERRGIQLTKSFIDWSNIATILAYVAETQLADQSFNHFMNGTKSPNGAANVLDSPLSELSRSPGVELVDACVDFLAHNFATDFSFDRQAPQLSQSPRLPSNSPGARPSTADPRLSQIHFGETEDVERPQDPAALLSSILLSLPFDMLKALLEHPRLHERMPPPSFERLQQSVVEERERRRAKAFKSVRGLKHPRNFADAALYDNVLWIEQLDRSDTNSSLTLARYRYHEA